eukprot:COSAG04_NODE_193_length_20833_cov_9.922205_14_plen_370_part_00
MLKRRAAMVLDTWIGGVSGISTTEQLLELSAGDVSTLAMHNAQIGSFINFPEMFLAPVFCAFSDQIGRVGAMTIGPLGLGLFWLAQTQLKSLNVRFWVYMLFRGCMRAGVTDIRESAFNDLFAAQPETYAILKASETVWANLGTLSSFGIALLVRRFIASNNACFFLSSALAALQAVVLASTEETLDVRDRKPIHSIKSLLLQANPVSLIVMLLRNGPGLFALAISRVLWRASTRVGYLIAPLQLSVLNWSPDQQGVFNQLIMPTLNIPLSRLVVQPALRVQGIRDVWRIATLGARTPPVLAAANELLAYLLSASGSALGYALIGQSFRRMLPLSRLSLFTLTGLQCKTAIPSRFARSLTQKHQRLQSA